MPDSCRRALEAQSEQSGAWVRELPDADLHGLASAAERVCPVHASFVARIPGAATRSVLVLTCCLLPSWRLLTQAGTCGHADFWQSPGLQ